MNCPACNKEINDNAKFCKYCGKKIDSAKSIPEVTEDIVVEEVLFIKCPSCGKDMHHHKAFCTNCGSALNKLDDKKPVEYNLKNETSERQNKKRFKIILCIVLILIIAGVVVTTLHFKNSNINKAENVVENSDEDEVKDEKDDTDFSEDNEENGIIDNTTETNSELDVETEVVEIRDTYNAIVSAIENNNYKEKTIENGFVTYSDNDNLKAIIISKDYSTINYDCFYYFDNDKLFFAYYEGENSHRFYFKDDVMIRWRKCEDASNPENGINHDMENTSEYSQWQSTVQQNAQILKLAWNAAGTLESDSEYLLPGSDTRIITESELDELTKEEVKLARNEIYARHGRKFDDESLKAYFEQFDWYHPTIEPEDFEESMLNDYEVINRDFIVLYEEEKGYR